MSAKIKHLLLPVITRLAWLDSMESHFGMKRSKAAPAPSSDPDPMDATKKKEACPLCDVSSKSSAWRTR